MIDPYLVAFEETNDQYWVEKCLEYVSDWHRWLKSTKRLGRAWYDLSTSLRTCKLALLADWLGLGRIDAEYRSIIEPLCTMHFIKLVDKTNFNSGNHGIFHAHGLRALCVAKGFHNARRKQGIDISLEFLNHLVETQFDEEGVHREGAFEYQRFALAKFTEVFESGVWGKEELNAIEYKVKKARDVARWMVFPDGREIPFGDTEGKRIVSASDWRTFHSLGNNVKTFACGYNFCHFKSRESSYDSTLFFNTGKQFSVHRHFDDFSIIWKCRGHDILIDLGKYAYVKDKYREYIRSALGHNTITIADENLEDPTVQAYDSKLIYKESSRNEVCFTAVRSCLQGSVTHGRAIYALPDCILLVIDEVIADARTSLRLNWHMPVSNDYIIDSETNGGERLLLRTSDSEEGAEIINIQTICMRGSWRFKHFLGQHDREVRGITSGSIYNSIERCHNLQWSCFEKSAMMISFFSMAKDGRDYFIEVEKNGTGLQVWEGNHLIRFIPCSPLAEQFPPRK